MGVDFGGLDIPFDAAEDLSSYQYRFVVQSDDDSVRLANAATDIPIGILQNDPESGERAVVRVTGTSKLVANAAFSVGDPVKLEYVGAADNGKGDAADTADDLIRAYCIQAAGAEDDLMAVLLCFNRVHA